ncbi:hypothetical protein BANT10_03214 [Brevibacterium antiquum]|uniref:Uncharacterized protein n=1 Tax=Brevibacterium antiquum TaxID=234835 RepID=A0A2H1KNJ0_9MICO|nr:hypothetical protein BANT10_03214 [Brevibacterium antiquum]
MPLVIPERTIDSMFTFEFISAAPRAIVVSPNNNRGPRTPDHEVETAARKFVFECKTLYTANRNSANWVVKVPLKQLHDYVSHGGSSIVYVLPATPTLIAQPWIRDCRDDPDPKGHCLACSNPKKDKGAIYQRRWAGQTPPVSSAPPETKLQPWFNHWAWCIRADDLQNHVTSCSSLISTYSGQVVDLTADDISLGAISGAVRFCHFLDAVEKDHDDFYDIDRTADDSDSEPWSSADAPESSVTGTFAESILRLATESVSELPSDEEDRRLIAAY